MHRSPTVNIKRWQAGVAIQRRKTKATYDSFTVYMAEVERPLRSPRKNTQQATVLIRFRPTCWGRGNRERAVNQQRVTGWGRWRREPLPEYSECLQLWVQLSHRQTQLKITKESQEKVNRWFILSMCVCVLCLFPCLLNSSWFYNRAGDKTGSRSCRTGLSRPGHEVLLTWNQVDTVSVHSSKFSSFLHKYWNMISYFLLLLSHLSCQVNCTSNAATH